MSHLFFCSQRSYIDTKGWDVFRTLPPEAATRSEATNSKLYFFSIKLLKVREYVTRISYGDDNVFA